MKARTLRTPELTGDPYFYLRESWPDGMKVKREGYFTQKKDAMKGASELAEKVGNSAGFTVEVVEVAKHVVGRVGKRLRKKAKK